ncbi:hypothetical protein RI129_007262 [Pyrocoelia pectoralis]|uniref:Uncharacterized protein n=1 Tax=Pyrocoelia pectoralis TaxID=417401 RepID=A0AAN7ZID3_9COLE
MDSISIFLRSTVRKSLQIDSINVRTRFGISHRIKNQFRNKCSKFLLFLAILLWRSSTSHIKKTYQFGLGLYNMYLYHLVRSRQDNFWLLSEIGISWTLPVVDNKIKNYIHASIHNFYLNEDTIDGKNTTHCMGLVVFQQRSENISFVGENRTSKGPYS